jgi:hypothetical protein
MGLDMWSCSISKEDVQLNESGDTILSLKEDCKKVEIAYWRKHNALHGWMENLYVSKGGTKEFNCIALLLTKEDLLQLKSDILDNKLKPTEGFFFGDTKKYEDVEYFLKVRNEDLKYIDTALNEIELGNIIYYDSWW